AIAARAADVLGKEAVEDVVALGHRAPVTVLVGVDEDEVDLAVAPPGGVAELGQLGVALHAPRREEVHNQGPLSEVGQSYAPAALERGEVERLGVGPSRAAAAVVSLQRHDQDGDDEHRRERTERLDPTGANGP